MVTVPAIAIPETPYVANMRALVRLHPRFACQIDQVGEKARIELELSKSGLPTCRLANDQGKAVWLHSRYDPEREGQRWADGVMDLARQQEDADTGKVPMCYVVDGFGLGYHVKALFERLAGEAFIVVSEPNLELIRTAFERQDFSEMLESKRVILLTQTDRAEIFRKLECFGAKLMMGIVFTHPLQHVASSFHVAIHQCISEFASYVRANLWTLMGCNIQTCKNIIHNLPLYVSTPSVGVHQKRFAGCPAVLVAAGPSLRNNIETLKKIRERVIVIAVQTVLKPLLASGIVPDFVTSLDFSEVCKRFFEGVEPHPEIHLVAEPKAHWDVIDAYREIGPMTLLGNQLADLLLGKDTDHAHLTSGTTVAHLSFYLAEYLGADPIILIGQDLGFSDNVYYAPGNALHDLWRPEMNRFCTIENMEWQRILRQGGSLRRVKDHHEADIYTDEEMFTYLQQFEKDFSRSKVRVIDASGGGVKKQFCQTLTLAEAAGQYCTKVIDRGLFTYQDRVEWYSQERLAWGREQLEKRIEDVEAFKDIVQETIGLVKEMLDLLDDQPKLNRKMVRLDELRSLVKQRQTVYTLVGLVSQTAEYVRFREDRRIGVANKQGKERQRQQLMRDIAYVSELERGCNLLITLLEEGIERFDEEIGRQEDTADNHETRSEKSACLTS